MVEKTAPTKSYCGLCSRLRRGILYTHTQQIGAQRLALGHHRDDALETLLLNMVHQGTMKAMPARYVASRGVDVIRPLMYCAEDDLREYATRLEFPILAVQPLRVAAGGQALATARRQAIASFPGRVRRRRRGRQGEHAPRLVGRAALASIGPRPARRLRARPVYGGARRRPGVSDLSGAGG